MASITRIVGVEYLGEASPGEQEGVISCEIVAYEDLDDDTLEILFEQSPDFVMEKRPDWVKKHHPESVQ